MNKKGLSLLEILIAGVILTLVLAGLLNTFLAGKRWVLHNRLRMTGGELGKLFLDPLQGYVRQDTWNQAGNSLNTVITYCDNDALHTQNPACPPSADRTIGGMEYSAQYNVTPHPTNPNIRKVVATIQWNEPQP
jgi:Tfp pilus assembly protein PilW